MSEAEILDGLFNARQEIVSGYIARAYLTFVHGRSKNATLEAT